ncbi:hypothetical protein TrST_g10131 [Triparma strigata]|uniref:DUF202 domain-containing protein n=1 Tax=Triparma strigata TaxID=1606541 RepID=A0A9W7E4H5_9STRA|nr:hypothetical protein TrST_g10131 [Triparma strigata]
MSGVKETTPLMSTSKDAQFYFLDRSNSQQGGKASAESVRNPIPQGMTPEQFQSRPVASRGGKSRVSRKGSWGGEGVKEKSGFFGSLLSLITGSDSSPESNRLKQRKVPIKVEPKVFFANERTFLAWLHTAVTLASISVAIISFAGNEDEGGSDLGAMYGLTLLPVSVCFIIYALRQYTSRAGMIRRREPGPYEDLTGPSVLAILLMVSIMLNFILKLYQLSKLG